MGDDLQAAEIDESNEMTWLLLNDELRYRHEAQRSAFERLEGRAAIVLGAATGALLFVAKEDVTSPWLIPALIAFAGSVVFSLIAVLPNRFEELKARSVVVGLWLRSRANAAAELANNRLLAIEENVARQARMALYVRIAVTLILTAAILSTIHLTQGDRADVVRADRSAACDPGAITTGADSCDS